MTFKTLIAAAGLALAAQAATTTATAAEIRLETPMAGQSLHAGGIAMAVYFMDRADHFEVVATYVTADAPADPQRLRMGLAEGDSTRFGLPGAPHVAFSFAREGDAVHVEATELGEDFASIEPDLDPDLEN